MNAYGVSEGVSFADGGGGKLMRVGVGLDILVEVICFRSGFVSKEMDDMVDVRRQHSLAVLSSK